MRERVEAIYREESRLVLATLAGFALLAVAVQGMFVLGLWLPLLPPALGVVSGAVTAINGAVASGARSSTRPSG